MTLLIKLTLESRKRNLIKVASNKCKIFTYYDLLMYNEF